MRKSKSRTTAKPSAKAPVAKSPVKKAARARPATRKVAPRKPAPGARQAQPEATVAAAARIVARKMKTIRDSFNMPAEDYSLIADLKKRALATAREVKKSELLRAGLRMLSALSDEAFKAALAAVPAVKTGRPGKKHKS